jgi:hypothetical protein
MVTPGGWGMSAALTDCGQVGWVTDRTAELAAGDAEAAGFNGFRPDAADHRLPVQLHLQAGALTLRVRCCAAERHWKAIAGASGRRFTITVRVLVLEEFER